jgi:uncharacterized protein (TIRG00374 family)
VDGDQPAEAPLERLGDRLEQAIEQRADLPGELARGEQELDAAPAQQRRSAIRRTAFWLVVSAVGLYLVAPSIVETFSSWEQIRQFSPAWLAVMALLETASVACVWALQRVAIHGSRWQPVIAAHLASNGLAKIVPGGATMASGLQYRMLVAAGLAPAAVVSGLTAASLLLFGVMLALPVFAVPSILRGGVQHDLLNAAVVGLLVFVLLFAVGAVVLTTDRLLLWVGRVVQGARNRLRRRAEPLEHLPQRLIGERDRIIDTVGPRWKRALAAALLRWGFDFGCLLAALKALDVLPRPGLVLLAFCAAQLLSQIPVTPGGLGFVEAGLTAMLALAGVTAGDAVIATFAYRLFSYWLMLPAGAVAYLVHRRISRRDAAASIGLSQPG